MENSPRLPRIDIHMMPYVPTAERRICNDNYGLSWQLTKTARAIPLLSKEGQARSAGVVCSRTRSHLIDAREALLVNRYCSSLNRPPQPSRCEGIPALLRRGMALTASGQQLLSAAAE